MFLEEAEGLSERRGWGKSSGDGKGRAWAGGGQRCVQCPERAERERKEPKCAALHPEVKQVPHLPMGRTAVLCH